MKNQAAREREAQRIFDEEIVPACQKIEEMAPRLIEMLDSIGERERRRDRQFMTFVFFLGLVGLLMLIWLYSVA